ncbi:conjugal transfer protein TraB [Streptomyces sp. NPDC053253]|uniref:conjugal transfer protein TraB n=1 Tax=Streptomyces sp. NPDC053253 TaxID=3365699 RepID=UPI0037D389C0
MSDIVPYKAPPLPVKGERVGFLSLVAQMATLAAAALSLKEGLWVLKHRMEKNAAIHDLISEMCAEAEVEPRFTALIADSATALRKVAEASAEVAGAADQMEANSRGFCDAHRTEYQGVYEAVNARPEVQQAKPGFYRKR